MRNTARQTSMGDVIHIGKKRKEVEDEAMDAADEYVLDIADELGELLHSYGFGVESEEEAKNFYYIIEALRSHVYYKMNLNHPFWKNLSNQIECHIDEDGNYSLEFSTPIPKLVDIEDDE
jgi:hypothetical protein